MANYLNSLINYEPIQTVLNDLNALSPSQLKKALSTIDPARNTYSTFSLQNIAFIFSDLISSRMNNQRFSQRLNQEEGGSEVAALIAGPIMRTAEKKQCLSYSTWASAFGTFAHEKEQNQTPAFDMNSEGVLVGFDLLGYQHATLGGSLGYARIDIKNDNHFGHQEINDYVASVYGDFSMCDFFLDLAVWGGYHQAKGKRHIFFSGFNETAHSKTHGWQVVPHLMLGYDVETRWFTLEPFAQFDWAVNFEHAFKEYGAAPLNMRQKANTSSLLRSEVGLAAYQTHTSCGGAMLIVKEKLSYVNKKTFHTGRATAAIVGAPGGTFTVDTFTGLQNLISPGLEIFYQTASNVFMSAAYEGEFGSGYRSNSVIAKLGKAF
jgi:outer membrane autotransporter protein